MTDQKIAEVGRAVLDITRLAERLHNFDGEQLLDLQRQLKEATYSNHPRLYAQDALWEALVPALDKLFTSSVW